MANQDIINKTRDLDSASWAIWSDNFGGVNCIERLPENIYSYILDKSNELKPQTIFLALNKSGVENNFKPFQNFHGIGQGLSDKFLRDIIKDNDNLVGAFMTDIDNKTIETDSNKIRIDSTHLDVFVKQLQLFGLKKFNIICLGDMVFNSFKEKMSEEKLLDHNIRFSKITIDDIKLNLYRVRHYSARYPTKNELKEQLPFINNILNKE